MSRAAPSERPPRSPAQRRNRTIGIVCGVVFLGMIGAAYAAVPVYKAFCQATGYGGTTRRAETHASGVLDRTLTVRFDTNVRDLPLTFVPEQASQTMKIGATEVAYFKVTNTADHQVVARALYNVTPDAAGRFFNKLQCFCFSDTTIGPHQTLEMPVVYFVDPKFVQDRDVNTFQEVTLSYTFFPAVDAKPAGAPKS